MTRSEEQSMAQHRKPLGRLLKKDRPNFGTPEGGQSGKRPKNSAPMTVTAWSLISAGVKVVQKNVHQGISRRQQPLKRNYAYLELRGRIVPMSAAEGIKLKQGHGDEGLCRPLRFQSGRARYRARSQEGRCWASFRPFLTRSKVKEE